MKFLILLLICCSNLLTVQAQDSLANLSLDELKTRYRGTKNPELRLVYIKKMLKVGEETLDTRDTAYAKLLFQMGIVKGKLYQLDEGISFLEQALSIQELKAPNSKTHIQILSKIGEFYSVSPDVPKAIPYLLSVLDIYKETKREIDILYVATIGNLGVTYSRLEDRRNTEKYFVKAVEMSQKLFGKEHIYYATGMNNLGLVYMNMDMYEKAEDCYLSAIDFFEKNNLEGHPTYLFAIGNLGSTYMYKKEYEKAEKYYLQTAELMKNVLGKNHPDYLISFGNLGLAYKEMNQLDKSEECYLKVLPIYEKNKITDDPNYVASLANLSTLYADQKMYAKAEAIALKALDFKAAEVGIRDISYINILNLLSGIYLKQKDFEKTWYYTQLAIKTNTNHLINQDFDINILESISNGEIVSKDQLNTSLITIFSILGESTVPKDKQKQLQVVNLALDLLKGRKNALLDDQDKLSMLYENSIWVDLCLNDLGTQLDSDKIFHLIEQNKSVLLLDAISNKRIYTENLLPDSLVKMEQDFDKKYVNLNANLAENRPKTEKDSLRQLLSSLNLEIDNFQKQLKQNYPKYAAIRYEHDIVQLEEIQANLDQQTGLLEYFIGDSTLYVFLVEKNQTHTHTYTISREELEQKIEVLHAVLSDYYLLKSKPQQSYDTYTQTAYWFYQNLLSPVLKKSSNLKNLIVIPDEKLGHLPFETFLVEAAPTNSLNYAQLHYLIQDYSISYNYSATLWKENSNNIDRRNNGQMLGLAANYKISADSSIEDKRLPSDLRTRDILSPLAAARTEVEGLSKQFKGEFWFDKQASERNFKEQAADFAILHLAMHGLLNSREPVLSSLAFTENSDSIENNFLHAYEISQMELNADLVVLSACETGFGKFEQGNGIASLARSFMYAGTPALVVSLWEVNDGSTGLLMQYFYANLAKGMNKDEALRQAKLNYLKKAKDIAAHPAFWSPFIMMGNTQSVKLQTKGGGNSLWWWIGGGVIAVVGGGLALRKRQK